MAVVDSIADEERVHAYSGRSSWDATNDRSWKYLSFSGLHLTGRTQSVAVLRFAMLNGGDAAVAVFVVRDLSSRSQPHSGRSDIKEISAPTTGLKVLQTLAVAGARRQIRGSTHPALAADRMSAAPGTEPALPTHSDGRGLPMETVTLPSYR